MRKVLLIFFLVLLPGIVCAQPAIEFDAVSHDFGKVDSFAVEHIFEFTNTGDEDLLIEKIHAS
jgi:hypothetical protein